MQNAILISQILGPIYVIFAVGMMLNTGEYKKVITEVCKSPALIFLSGCLALTFGVIMLQAYHLWLPDWTLVITLIGWSSVLKGALLIIFPVQMGRVSLAWNTEKISWTRGTIALILGLGFSYFGFFV